jgi:hypothetical protein
MSYVSDVHYFLGYSVLGLLLIEVLWSFVEALLDSDPGTVSTIKTKSVVGLVDLQALLGIINAGFYYPTYQLVHGGIMLLAVGLMHAGSKQDGWSRTIMELLALVAVVMGIGTIHMMR